MTEVKAYGIIVGEDCDDAMFKDIIDAGVITPSSKFCREVEAADDNLTIRINSWGGEIFAGNKMIIAMQRWGAAHPRGKLTINVEAIAFSIAACMVAKAPAFATVNCYPESMLMFHGGSTMTMGGAGAHKDAAQFLDKFNASVIRALINRTYFDEDEISTWFQDGRMGWLDAEDCMNSGLIDNILKGEMPPPPPDPGDEQPKGAFDYVSFCRGQQLALAMYKTENKETKMPEAKNEDPEKEVILPQEDPEEDKAVNEEDVPPEEEKPEEEKPEEKPEDGCGEEDPEKKEAEDLRQQLADCQAKLDAANAMIAKLTKGLGIGSGTNAAKSSDFRDLLKTIPTNLSPVEWDKAFKKLKAENPTAYETYVNTHQKRTI